MCKSILKGQNVPGTDGTYHGTDGTCPRDRRDTHTRGCPAKILYVYWFCSFPSKPHHCNMPQAKTEVALQFSECCAAEVALQHWLFCSVDVILTKSCAAASKKLQCNIEKAALQESGAFLPLSCRFPADFKLPRLGST